MPFPTPGAPTKMMRAALDRRMIVVYRWLKKASLIIQMKKKKKQSLNEGSICL